jgi:cytochrome c553
LIKQLKIKGKKMKKITIVSVVAAAVLFTGCGEKTKESATDSTTKAVESTKEAASHAVDAAKEATDKAVKAVTEAGDSAAKAADQAVEATKEAATEAVDSAKESVATATATAATAVADTATNVAGAAAYAKCAGCHGADGKTKALGKSPEIAGQSKEALIVMMKEYKAGTRNVSGMGNLMKGQVATMDDAAIEAVSAYISTLK